MLQIGAQIMNENYSQNINMESIKITLKNIDKIIINFKLDQIIFDKSELGETEQERIDYNLYANARKYPKVKDFVINLANNGFYMTAHSQGISTFSSISNIDKFSELAKIKKQRFNNIFFDLELLNTNEKKQNLLVIFSSVADFPYNADISRRNFFPNFKSIYKYIPYNTNILRISDIGGVVGSFYLNNNFNLQVESNIQTLLKKIATDLSIAKENIVLYGVSKGGTASLYHGILGGYKCVAVDPIVCDEYHQKKHQDSHFTIGTFPESKKEKFKQLMNQNIHENVNIIYSKNSPIFKDIESIIKSNDKYKKINYFNIEHPKIKDHPDVGPNTINILMLIINNLFYEFYKKKTNKKNTKVLKFYISKFKKKLKIIFNF